MYLHYKCAEIPPAEPKKPEVHLSVHTSLTSLVTDEEEEKDEEFPAEMLDNFDLYKAMNQG